MTDGRKYNGKSAEVKGFHQAGDPPADTAEEQA